MLKIYMCPKNQSDKLMLEEKAINSFETLPPGLQWP